MTDRFVATSAAPGADVDSLSSGAVASTSISDSTSVGRALLTASDAAAARAVIGAASAADIPSGLPTIYHTSSSVDGDYGAPCALNWSSRPTVPATGQTYLIDVTVFGSHQTYTATRGVFHASFAAFVRTWDTGEVEVAASSATTELAAGGPYSLSGVTLALSPVGGGNTFDVLVTSPSPVIARYTGRVEIRG